MLLIFLNIFNVLESKDEKIKSLNHITDYFIISLSHFIDKQLKLIGHWDELETQQQTSLSSVLLWGPHFLKQM